MNRGPSVMIFSPPQRHPWYDLILAKLFFYQLEKVKTSTKLKSHHTVAIQRK